MSGGGEYAIATFHSTHAVLAAEKLLKGEGLGGIRLVPVPSQVSSDCGVTIRFLAADVSRAALLMRERLAEDIEGVFVQTADGGWEPYPG